MAGVLRATTVLLVGVILAGCSANTSAGSSASAVASASSPAALPSSTAAVPGRDQFDGAELVRAGTNAFLALRSGGLYLLSPGQLRPLTPPFALTGMTSPPGIAATDSQHVVAVAAGDPQTVSVRVSSDGGQSWSPVRQVRVPTDSGIAAVRASVMGLRVVVLANEQSSSNALIGMLGLSPDGGQTWSVVGAPSGGAVYSAGGVFWLVGGPTGDQVFASADGTAWQQASVPVDSSSWTAGQPVDVTGLGVVFPVTTHGQGPSQLQFLASADGGATWRTVGSAVGPQTEANTTLPVSITADGDWTMVWPDGSKVLAGSLSQGVPTAVLSPNGLGGGAYGVVRLTQNEIVAVASSSTCPNGKASCTSSTVLLRSIDNGQTWAPVI